MGSSHGPKSGLLTRLPPFNKVRTTREVDMPKSSFVLYLDYKKHFDLIQDDTDFRRLIEAIFAYCEDGSEPSNLSPVAEMAFSFIRANLDRDNGKYNETKEKSGRELDVTASEWRQFKANSMRKWGGE